MALNGAAVTVTAAAACRATFFLNLTGHLFRSLSFSLSLDPPIPHLYCLLPIEHSSPPSPSSSDLLLSFSFPRCCPLTHLFSFIFQKLLLLLYKNLHSLLFGYLGFEKLLSSFFMQHCFFFSFVSVLMMIKGIPQPKNINPVYDPF